MKLEDLQRRAIAIRVAYDELNRSQGAEPWNGQSIMTGFSGDVGMLAKLVMAKQGLREMEDVNHRLAHELSDCLWSVLVLADHYGIDLVAAFEETMREIEARISSAHKCSDG